MNKLVGILSFAVLILTVIYLCYAIRVSRKELNGN